MLLSGVILSTCFADSKIKVEYKLPGDPWLDDVSLDCVSSSDLILCIVCCVSTPVLRGRVAAQQHGCWKRLLAKFARANGSHRGSDE
jgi:hypothetical protein